MVPAGKDILAGDDPSRYLQERPRFGITRTSARNRPHLHPSGHRLEGSGGRAHSAKRRPSGPGRPGEDPTSRRSSPAAPRRSAPTTARDLPPAHAPDRRESRPCIGMGEWGSDHHSLPPDYLRPPSPEEKRSPGRRWPRAEGEGRLEILIEVWIGSSRELPLSLILHARSDRGVVCGSYLIRRHDRQAQLSPVTVLPAAGVFAPDLHHDRPRPRVPTSPRQPEGSRADDSGDGRKGRGRRVRSRR